MANTAAKPIMSAKKNQPASTPAPHGAKPGPPPGREGYKHTKLGWIPEEWEVKQFGKAFDRIKRELTPERQVLYRELGIKSHGKGLFYKEPKDGEELGEKSVYWVEPDCLIFNIVFAWEQAVARTTHEDNGLIASHRFPMYRAKRNVADLDFVLYFLKTKRGKLLLENASPGGAGRNKTLSQGDLNKSFIPFPPYPEQRRIAALLGTWDRAIALVKELLAAQQARKRGLMQELLSGKRRFPGFWGKWKEVRLGELGTITNGGTPDTTVGEYWNGDIPWFTPTEITALNGKTAIERSERMLTKAGLANCTGSLLPAGAIIVCTRATVGQAAILAAPGTTNQGFKNIVPNAKVSSKFLFYQIAIHVHKLQRLACGSTFPEVSMKDFRNLPVLLPERPEQDRICEVFDAIDGEMNAMNARLTHLTTQKRGLMQQLLTGAVRVKATSDETNS